MLSRRTKERPKYRLVNAEQLATGYFEMRRGVVYQRRFTVIRDNGDGTYCVEEPSPNPFHMAAGGDLGLKRPPHGVIETTRD